MRLFKSLLFNHSFNYKNTKHTFWRWHLVIYSENHNVVETVDRFLSAITIDQITDFPMEIKLQVKVANPQWVVCVDQLNLGSSRILKQSGNRIA